MNKMHDHITDGPDEDDWNERNAYPKEPEYEKYRDDFLGLTGHERSPEPLSLRITLAIEHLVKHNSFDHRDLVQLLKDCQRALR